MMSPIQDQESNLKLSSYWALVKYPRPWWRALLSCQIKSTLQTWFLTSYSISVCCWLNKLIAAWAGLWHSRPGLVALSAWACGTPGLVLWHSRPGLVALSAWVCGTPCLWHSLLVALPACGTPRLWHSLLVALLACGTPCLWHSLLVALPAVYYSRYTFLKQSYLCILFNLFQIVPELHLYTVSVSPHHSYPLIRLFCRWMSWSQEVETSASQTITALNTCTWWPTIDSTNRWTMTWFDAIIFLSLESRRWIPWDAWFSSAD